MTRQIIRTPHGDYEIIQTASGFYIQDPEGYQIGTAGPVPEDARGIEECGYGTALEHIA